MADGAVSGVLCVSGGVAGAGIGVLYHIFIVKIENILL
jgi:hypothetical protein